MKDIIMLDTSGYALFKRGEPQAVQVIRQSSAILIPTIVIGELFAGFDRGTKTKKNREELEAFLSSPRVRVVDIVFATTERYSPIYGYLRGNGTPIPTNDLWIAASAMEHGVCLLTADMHFQKVPHIISVFITVHKE